MAALNMVSMVDVVAPEHLRYAVVDDPAGTKAVVAPPVRIAALALKDRHRGDFWCSTVAGGCGGPLTLAAGPLVRPYFRHRPGATCSLAEHPENAGGAYEHVQLQHALLGWLQQQDLVARVEHTFGDGGGRADLHVVVDGVKHSLEVQLSPISVASWNERDQRYRRFVRQVSWLYGTTEGGEAAAAAAQARTGVAIQIRSTLAVDTQEAVVQVGVLGLVTLAGPPELRWSALGDCELRPSGVWVPHLEEAAAWHAAAELERAQHLERVRSEARAAAKRRDATRVRAASALAARTAKWAAEPLPLPAPARPRETVQQWLQKRPVPPGWVPEQGWGWMQELVAHDREAARVIAYTVQELYVAAAVSMLDLDGIDDLDALLVVLRRHEVLHVNAQEGAYPGQEATQRWGRGQAPVVGCWVGEAARSPLGGRATC